jgi:predicted HD superfamily hydrolase involved in NAD metabolism
VKTDILYSSVLNTLQQNLSQSALNHSTATAIAAVEIATVYELDADEARLAGLAHDRARDIDPQKLIELAEEHDLTICSVDREVPYLLHARLGAVLLSREFPEMSQRVLDAVARHTVGSAEMTDLDMVVYVADMTEPGRVFTGVEDLRAEIGQVPLDELFCRAYRHSVAHIVATRRRIHPDTVSVWNSVVAGDRS